MRLVTRWAALAVFLVAGGPTSAAKNEPPDFKLAITMEAVDTGGALSDWDGRLQASGTVFSDRGPVGGAAGDVDADQGLYFDGKKGSFFVSVSDIRILSAPRNPTKPNATWKLEAYFILTGLTGEYEGLFGGGTGTGKRITNGATVEQTWSVQGYLAGIF